MVVVGYLVSVICFFFCVEFLGSCDLLALPGFKVPECVFFSFTAELLTVKKFCVL